MKTIYERLWDSKVWWRIYEKLLWIPFIEKRESEENKKNFDLDIKHWMEESPEKYQEYLDKDTERERHRKLIALQVEEKKLKRKKKNENRI